MTIDIEQMLSEKQYEVLLRLSNDGTGQTFSDSLKHARRHLIAARDAHSQNGVVNVKMAEAIVHSFEKVALHWDSLSDHAQYWFKGAVLYFLDSDDEISDFESIIGFEDDAEVLNACLLFADLGDHCIDPEQFDEI